MRYEYCRNATRTLAGTLSDLSSVCRAQGFRSLADGESVEFTPVEDSNGRRKATVVTGPGGSEVQGAPFRDNDYDSY